MTEGINNITYEIMKTILNELYRMFLMPYLERDKYFEELCDETEKECEAIALKILNKN